MFESIWIFVSVKHVICSLFCWTVGSSLSLLSFWEHGFNFLATAPFLLLSQKRTEAKELFMSLFLLVYPLPYRPSASCKYGLALWFFTQPGLWCSLPGTKPGSGGLPSQAIPPTLWKQWWILNLHLDPSPKRTLLLQIFSFKDLQLQTAFLFALSWVWP